MQYEDGYSIGIEQYKKLTFIVIIEDSDNEGKSVTNRIEDIVSNFNSGYASADGCIYMDSTGVWDGFNGRDFILLNLDKDTDINYVMASYILKSGMARLRQDTKGK